MNTMDPTLIVECYSELCGDEEISIESDIWNTILCEKLFINIHTQDFYSDFEPLLQNLRLNTSKTHNLETFINYLFLLARKIDFKHYTQTNSEERKHVEQLTKGIYILRIIIQYIFRTCDDDELPPLFGILHMSPKDYTELYSYNYISDIYGYTMMKLYLLIINIIILYTPTDIHDDLYNEVLSLFIELFYKRSQTVFCSSIVSPYFSENFFIDLFMIAGETFFYDSTSPWESFTEGYHQYNNTLDTQNKHGINETHKNHGNSPISSDQLNDDNDEDKDINTIPSIPKTWASELIHKLLSNIINTFSTASQSSYLEFPSLSQLLQGVTKYISSSSITTSYLYPSVTSSPSTSQNLTQQSEKASPSSLNLSPIISGAITPEASCFTPLAGFASIPITDTVKSNYICIYSEMLLCLLTCVDVNNINPYKNILKLYKNKHNSVGPSLNLNIHNSNNSNNSNNSESISNDTLNNKYAILTLSFSPLYQLLTENLLFEPNLICFYCLILYVPAFRDCVVSKNDSETYILSLLHALYSYCSQEISIETVSVLLPIFLLLSEYPSFISVLFNTVVKKPTWFMDRQTITDINIGCLLLCILIKIISYTCNSYENIFVLTTSFSLLLNLLQYSTDLSSYTCMRLVDLLILMKNKYVYIKEQTSVIDCENYELYLEQIERSNISMYEQYTQFLLQYIYILMISPNKEKNISLIYECLHRYLQLRPFCHVIELQSYVVPIIDLLDSLNDSLSITPNSNSSLSYFDSESLTYDVMMVSLRKQLRLLVPTTSAPLLSPCFVYEDSNTSHGFFNAYVMHIINQYCTLLNLPV